MPRSGKTSFLKDNGLTIAVLALFLFSWIGQLFAGWHSHNNELETHGQATIPLLEYVVSGHFLESTFENWESEFLQMMIFVVLSSFLYQRGSSESNPLPDEHSEKSHYKKKYFVNHPLLRKLYESSLSLALLVLFLFSFLGHWWAGLIDDNVKRSLAPQPQPPQSAWEFLSSSEFWFQSFQNWQSEFLSIGVITYLSIYLRQKGSAQSKPVDAPHTKTEEGAG